MITYCSNCKINWATLWTNDGDDHDVYEFCPHCKSGIHMQDGNDIVAYIKCPISGKITNTTTGLELQIRTEYKKPVIRIKVGKPTWQEIELQREQREDAAIAAYINSGNPSIFFQTIKKYQNAIR